MADPTMIDPDADVIPSWRRDSVSRSSAWKPPSFNSELIRLDLNENQFVNLDEIGEIFRNLSVENISRYPDYTGVEKEICRTASVPIEQLIVTNGADQAIEMVVRSLNPESKVIVVVPTFSYYQHVIELEGLNAQKVWYDADFSFNADRVLELLTPDTSAVLLTSPSNPLTTEISENDLVRVLSVAREYSSLVVVDEVYAQFTERNFLNLLDEYDNLVLIRSLSKFHGLASIRLGYICASADNIQTFQKIRGPWDISGHAAQIAEMVLKSQSWTSYVEDIARNRVLLSNMLEKIGAVVVPSTINFILFQHHNAPRLVEWLENNGVVVALMTNYKDAGGLLENYIRIAVPNDEQILVVQSALEGFKFG